MKGPTLVTLILVAQFCACKYVSEKPQGKKDTLAIDTILKDSSDRKNAFEETLKTIPKNIKPVLGYRFEITGDFDGDGKYERLQEHFFSALDHKETNKFYEGLEEYDQLVALTIKNDPYSFVHSDNASIDTLQISSSGQLLGLSYLKNEGDLNGDGTDEVSYVVNWADWSNLNTWHIVTFHKGAWQKLYSFPIWDWQLPDLPETSNQYGLFGLENKYIDPAPDTLVVVRKDPIYSFEGLVKKIKRNKIRIIFRNEEATLDTMVVDLRRPKSIE